jgi:hypothetical protein
MWVVFVGAPTTFTRNNYSGCGLFSETAKKKGGLYP